MQREPLEIAYLISRYPSVSHTFIQREIQQLRAQGFTIHIVSINASDIVAEQMQEIDKREIAHTFYVQKQGAIAALGEFLKSVVTKPLSTLKGFWYCCRLGGLDIKRLILHWFYFAEALLIGAWMQRKQIRHLHVHFANPASTVALITSKIFPITFSMTVHGPDEFYDVTRNHLKEKITGTQWIFCISNFAKSQLMFLSPPSMWSKFDVIRLGVDPTIYSPISKSEKNNPLFILTVGRLASAKGHLILIRAIKLLNEQELPIKLHLVGDGPERQNLEEQVRQYSLQEHVHFYGALNPQATLELYAKADIFALASFAEGLPVVLMEAMSREIPCVATEINGIPELIHNEHNGLLVSPADANALAAALTKLIHDPAMREKLGKAGRVTILEQFTLQTNVQQLAEAFKKHLKQL